MLFLGSRFWFLVFLWLRILGPWLCSKGIGICSYLYTKYWGIVCKVCVYYCRTYDKAVCVFYYRSGPITKMFACVPVPVCVFITAGPITKLFAGGDGTREEPSKLLSHRVRLFSHHSCRVCVCLSGPNRCEICCSALPLSTNPRPACRRGVSERPRKRSGPGPCRRSPRSKARRPRVSSHLRAKWRR